MSLSQLEQQKVQSLIVPLRHQNLILPQASLAEVISMPELRKIEESEDWLIGVFNWRKQEVPLVSVEQLCGIGNPDHINRSRRIAVFYGLEKIPGIEYYAVEIQAIPHPVLLGSSDVVSIEADSSCEIIAQHVQAVGIKGFLPDLGVLEQRLREQLELL